MPLSTFHDRRERFRGLLTRPALTSPASVFDPASARLAAAAGYEFGLLGGSIASATILAAPDFAVITLTEFAEQARRINRASDLPLMVDSDHGYGNALSVRRTVEEMEAAGVSAMSIEDTVLPARYGASDTEVISRSEFRDKLRAAIDARTDNAMVIIGRTIVSSDTPEVLARVDCCTEAGVDAIFLIGRVTRELLAAIHGRSNLPLLTGFPQIAPDELIDLGVRLQTAGHQGYFVMLGALWDYYVNRRAGQPTEAFRDRELPPEQRKIAFAEEAYASWTKQFLAQDPKGNSRL